MKIDKITKICKKAKQVVLAEIDGKPFIGTSRCVYNIEGMPVINEKNVLKLLGVNDSDKEKWQVIEKKFEDIIADEYMQSCGVYISFPKLSGSEFIALRSDKSFYYVDTESLQPFGDQAYAIAKVTSGDCVAVYDVGSKLIGLIEPSRIACNSLASALEYMALKTRDEYDKYEG